MGNRALENRIKRLRAFKAQQKELKATFPDIYSQFAKETASKRFSIV